eukprot:SAG31_NODE_458_length_15415_cov_3.647428_8_plen_185_part_00
MSECAWHVHVRYREAGTWPRPRLQKYLAARGLKQIIVNGPYSGSPWLGDIGGLPDPRYPDVPNASEYLSRVKLACQRLQEIDPEIQCLAPFETAMSPDNPPNDTAPRWLDSVSIQPDGHAAGYRWPCKNPQDTSSACQEYKRNHEMQFLYYPLLNVSNATTAAALRVASGSSNGNSYYDYFAAA